MGKYKTGIKSTRINAEILNGNQKCKIEGCLAKIRPDNRVHNMNNRCLKNGNNLENSESRLILLEITSICAVIVNVG